MDLQRITGTLVAATSTPYSGFTDERTGEKRPGGSTLRVYVSTSFEQAPIEVKVPAAEAGNFEAMRSAGLGTQVCLDVQLTAKGGGATGRAFIERKFLRLVPVAPAGNGTRPAAAVAAK